MKEYTHEGTILHTSTYYTIQRNNQRSYTDEKPNLNHHAIFHWEAYIQPPLMLTPITWSRYNYTTSDIMTSFDKMDASFVWQLALLLLNEIEQSSTSVRATFQSLFSFLFMSRKHTLELLLQHTYTKPIDDTTSILCHERIDHKPLLPKVIICQEDFYQLMKQIPKRKPSFLWTPIFQHFYSWKDAKYVPLEYDDTNHLIYMVRILNKDIYNAWPIKRKECAITQPSYVYIESQKQEYMLLDEACFFCMGDSNKPRVLLKRKLEH